MKKLLFLILLFATINGKSQVVDTWSGTLDIGNIQSPDSVLQKFIGVRAAAYDISSYNWTATFDIALINKPIRISLGGSGDLISSANYVYAFKSFPSDSFPCLLKKSLLKDTIRNSGYTAVTYKKVIMGEGDYGFKMPMFKVYKDSTGTTGTLSWKIEFRK